MVNYLQPQAKINVTHDFLTKNQSFLDIHYFLKNKGIENNKFFLVLYDSDLLGINPRDPRLNDETKSISRVFEKLLVLH